MGAANDNTPRSHHTGGCEAFREPLSICLLSVNLQAPKPRRGSEEDEEEDVFGYEV